MSTQSGTSPVGCHQLLNSIRGGWVQTDFDLSAVEYELVPVLDE